VVYAACAIGVLYAIVTLVAKPSFTLTVFGDIAQLTLAALVTAAFAVPVFSSRGRVRSFWLLMTVGTACWCISQTLWSYYEVILRKDALNPSVQDMVLFLHLIPMMAALACMPHLRRKMPPMIPYSLGMLAVWWMYLYFYAVIPWQYVVPDAARYGTDFNVLYSIEDFSFIAILAGLAWHADGAWRTFYRRLLLGSLGYTISSLVLNEAINDRRYYTGSFFDLPLVFSIICICWAAASASPELRDDSHTKTEESLGAGWLPRIAFVALLSVPILAAWALRVSSDPLSVRDFRVGVSLVATIALGALLFAVQRVLSSRLEQSLLEVSKSNEELSRAREALQHQATHDCMTGAMNRSAIVEGLARELSRSARNDTRVSVLLIDLDHFKDINDRFGHHAGDVAIIAACTRMQDCVRAHDLLGRYGGEEFLVVIPESDFDTAMQIAERIRKHVAAEPVRWQSNEITVTATIGIALSRVNDTPEQLLRRAVLAVYEGKNVSRDTVKVAVGDMNL
jgi:diguanylate cyclase (GGDEF)-like protein